MFCERERWVYLAHSGFLVLFLQGKFHFGRIINHCYFLRFDRPLLRSGPSEKRKKLSQYPTHQAWSIPHMNLFVFVCLFFFSEADISNKGAFIIYLEGGL